MAKMRPYIDNIHPSPLITLSKWTPPNAFATLTKSEWLGLDETVLVAARSAMRRGRSGTIRFGIGPRFPRPKLKKSCKDHNVPF